MNSSHYFTVFFIFALALCTVSCSPKLNPTIQSSANYHEQIQKYWEDRFNGFYSDPSFPLNASDSEFLSYFKPDADYQVEARVELLIGEQPFQMPTYAGTTAEYIRYGTAEFQIGDGPITQLTLYRSTRLFTNPMYRNHLFVPFLDETNGDLTYGGGRYLDLSIDDIKEGKMIIDFNKAYNPLCAYSGGYRCPIPPTENHLSIAIMAGELNYTGTIKERPNP